LLKQSNGSYGGTVGASSDGVCLPILLAYLQRVYPQIIIKNLYAIPPSLFVPLAPPWHCVYLRPLRDSVCPHCQIVFMKTNILILQKLDKALKKHYIISN